MRYSIFISLALGMALTGCRSQKPYAPYKSKEVSVVLDPRSGGATQLDFRVTGKDRKRIIDAPKNGETVTLHVETGSHAGDPKKRATWNQMFAYGYPDASGPNAWFFQTLNTFEINDAVFEAGGKACPPAGDRNVADVRRAIAVGNLTLDGRTGCPNGRPDGTIQLRSWVTVQK